MAHLDGLKMSLKENVLFIKLFIKREQISAISISTIQHTTRCQVSTITNHGMSSYCFN